MVIKIVKTIDSWLEKKTNISGEENKQIDEGQINRQIYIWINM